MQRPIFKKSDFRLCTIPVPEGYPQSQTHAGIACYDGRFYLTCSPYPVKKFTWISAHWYALLQKISMGIWGKTLDAEKFENPMLYVGEGKKGLSPTFFEPLSPFPLMDTPKPMFSMPAYNSDPDIFIDEGRIYILNRAYYRKPATNDEVAKKEVLLSLIKGSIDEKGFQFLGIEEFKRSSNSLISPCLIKYRGEYLFTQLETNSAIDGNNFDGLYVQKAATVDGLCKRDDYSIVKVNGGDLLPWHMSLFTYNEELYTIITCVKKGDTSHLWQMMGKFNPDVTELTIYPRPLTDSNSYRGAAVVVDENFVLYTTTLNDKVKGSKSVDGRDILMASMPMKELIKQLESE